MSKRPENILPYKMLNQQNDSQGSRGKDKGNFVITVTPTMHVIIL